MAAPMQGARDRAERFVLAWLTADYEPDDVDGSWMSERSVERLIDRVAGLFEGQAPGPAGKLGDDYTGVPMTGRSTTPMPSKDVAGLREACLEIIRWAKDSATRRAVAAKVAKRLGVPSKDIGRVVLLLDRLRAEAGVAMGAGSPRRVSQGGVGTRLDDCMGYRCCLAHAADGKWPGFSCDACEGPSGLSLPPGWAYEHG